MSMKSIHADIWGILDGYEDTRHRWHNIGRQTRAALRKAMGEKAGARGAPEKGQVLLLQAGESRRLTQPVEVTLEDGAVVRAERHLPPDLPMGYHTLRPHRGNSETHLIVSPGRCYFPDVLRKWGWALQLYSLRSRGSWGIGDFADLRRFGRWSGHKLGSNFILLNPIGAPLPVLPQEASPYFPSSRLYLNPLYLRVEEVPGAAGIGALREQLAAAGHQLNAHRLINRDAVFRLKTQAFEKIYRHFHRDERFEKYRAEQGETLRRFATFCVLAERLGGGWREWPARFRRPDSAAVREFAARHSRRIDFHEWLQWLLDEQFAAAARESSLMLDVSIGVRADGFDAWLWQNLMALDASVGVPPDEFNTQGQNWGMPPFIPHRLRASGYAPLRRTFRAMLRHAHGLRIDHVMGLFRLFWIPRGADPCDGAYVRYHADELLAVLAIESRRAGAIVVGEDLGTVEPEVRKRLRQNGILSYRLLWFENVPPERFPEQALAAITTHDLPTVAGLWSGKDLETQHQLGRHPNVAGTKAIRDKLRQRARLRNTASSKEAALGAHRLLARTPCWLRTAMLDDALAVEERPNMPGTTAEWPNWSIALPNSLEKIQRDAFVQKLAKVMAIRNKAKTRAH
jgi:4-alpha-glucanotransferase